MTDVVVETNWSWLMEPEHVCIGLVAENQTFLIGLAHFRGMPNPLRGQMIGFLDDLFVSSDFRSTGSAAALIMAVQEHAKVKGWFALRWITRDNNYRARGLCDKLAQKTDWMLYEMFAE